MMKALVVLLIFGGFHNAYCDLECEEELIAKCQKDQKERYEKGNMEDGLENLYCANSQVGAV